MGVTHVKFFNSLYGKIKNFFINKLITFSINNLLKVGISIFLSIFLWHYASVYMDIQKEVKEPKIIYLEDNAVKIQLVASKVKVKELEKLLAAKESTILKSVKDSKERVDEIARIKGVLKSTRKLQQGSSHVYLKGRKFDHHFIKIYNKAADDTEFPACWAMFHPNQDDPNKLWKTGTFNMEFYVDIIETENRNGTFNRYVELSVENNKNSKTKGKVFPIEITDIRWAKNPIKHKKFSWNPRLSMCGVITTENLYPGLGLSLFSYGKTAVDLDWKFLEIGLGGNADTINFFFEPLSWNFGKSVPLIKNAFVGPVVGINTESEIGYGLNLSIPF
jgi:hypothetical protein